MSKASEDWHYLKNKEVLAPIHLLLGSTSWYLPAVAYTSDRHLTDVVKVMSHQSCVMSAVRVPNGFFGIRDLGHLMAWILDFGGKGERDSGL